MKLPLMVLLNLKLVLFSPCLVTYTGPLLFLEESFTERPELIREPWNWFDTFLDLEEDFFGFSPDPLLKLAAVFIGTTLVLFLDYGAF